MFLADGKEYHDELYNCLIDKDDAVQDTLKSGAVPNKAAPLMPRAEVDEAVMALKDNKASGVDNIRG